jgi:hypothetical protein
MMPLIAAAAVAVVALLISIPYGQPAGPSPLAESAVVQQLLAAFTALPIGYLAAALLGSFITVRLSWRMVSD